MSNTQEWYSIAQIAAFCDCTTQTIYRWIDSGRIAVEHLSKEKSRGRFGWRYVVNRAALATLPVVDVGAVVEATPVQPKDAASVIQVITAVASPTITKCAACHQFFMVQMRGCTKALLGECDCPNCQGLCECPTRITE